MRPRWLPCVWTLLALTSSPAVLRAQGADDPAFRAALAFRYAPVHHQDVHRRGVHALDGQADFITGFDFDGDEDASNNWDHAGDPRFPLAARAYFSVVETGSHWFITYQFFHPRDWSRTFFETEHENDSEGVLLAVARDGSRFGSLRAAITVVHSDFFSFVPAGSPWRSGAESVDGTLTLSSYAGALHPVTAQQAETHALKAWPYFRIERQGVVYYPSLSEAQVPSGPDDRSVLYQLVDTLGPQGLWSRRANRHLLTAQGAFVGDRSGGCGRGVLLCLRNAAHAPWAWDDHNDLSPKGAIARDPAQLVRAYFDTHERVSNEYAFDPFR